MRDNPWRWILALSLFSVLTLILWTPRATAQLPDNSYFYGFRDFYEADYKAAGKQFSRGESSAYKVGTRRYVDSICYWTMMGECHFHLGNYAEALKLYEQSLALYVEHEKVQWQSRIRMPAKIQVDNSILQRTRITWGTPTRNATIPNLPEGFQTMFGRMDAERAFQEGGRVDNPEFKSVNVNEIMRCVGLCIYRRRIIKGPTAKYDLFSATLIRGLSGAGAGNGTLLGSYNGILLGLAQSSIEDYDRAAAALTASLQFNGGMDHPLTPVALAELAHIALQTGNFEAANRLSLEASYSAAVFDQYDLMEDSLNLGTKVHLINNKSVYPPLPAAIQWADRDKIRLLQVSLLADLAECQAESGQTDLAANTIRQARSEMNSRNSLNDCVISARLQYLAALVQFMQGNFASGLTDLNVAIQRLQSGSLWLFRLALADSAIVAGSVSQRQADLLYSVLLHDPGTADWKLDPMESLAFLATNHIGPMERWFEIVVDRKDLDRAVNIAELIRRHRFFANLPLGGRLMAFRWVIHAPDVAVPDTALQQRQDFLNRHPQYVKLMDRAKQLRDDLLKLPVAPEPGSDDAKNQIGLFKELDQVSNVQEAILASSALRREPAEMVFPPQFDIADFKKQIGKDQVALVTLKTATGTHSFFVNGSATTHLGVWQDRDVKRAVSGLLKKLGLMSNAIDVADLSDDSWKETAVEVKNQSFGILPDASWDDIRELVIVPDGLLWYMPYEVFQIGEPGATQNLADRVDIRYSPTLFLAYDPQRPERRLQRTGVVLAKMNSRTDNELTSNAFKELVADLPEAVKFEQSIRVPTNLLGSLLDDLVVWSEIRQIKGASPLATLPMQIDSSKTENSIGAWMSLPWYGPEHMVMPGYNSDGGASLRGKLDGSDLFLTSCGLMAAGTRTLLISRWSTGGANSLALTRNYAQRLPQMPPSQSLRESILESKKLDLNYEQEPRLRSTSRDAVAKAEHPVFWAGQMLFAIPDTAQPKTPVLPAAKSDVPDAAKADVLPGAANPAELKEGEAADDKKPADEPGGEENMEPAAGEPATADPDSDADGKEETEAKEETEGAAETEGEADGEEDSEGEAAEPVTPKKPGGIF